MDDAEGGSEGGGSHRDGRGRASLEKNTTRPHDSAISESGFCTPCRFEWTMRREEAIEGAMVAVGEGHPWRRTPHCRMTQVNPAPLSHYRQEESCAMSRKQLANGSPGKRTPNRYMTQVNCYSYTSCRLSVGGLKLTGIRRPIGEGLLGGRTPHRCMNQANSAPIHVYTSREGRREVCNLTNATLSCCVRV